MKVQAIKENNWGDILVIQEDAYHEFALEELEVLKSKQFVSPDTCFVCMSELGDVLGYLLSHPWRGFEPPKLSQSLLYVEESESLFLHDMAVKPLAKGRGAGRSMLNELIKIAKKKGVKNITLVAVQGAKRFWSLFGFKEVSNHQVCSSYGENAVLMNKVIET